MSIPLSANSFHGHVRALIGALHCRYLVEHIEKPPIFALLLDNKTQQTEQAYYSIMSVIISTVHASDYDARDNWKSWKLKTEMR